VTGGSGNGQRPDQNKPPKCNHCGATEVYVYYGSDQYGAYWECWLCGWVQEANAAPGLGPPKRPRKEPISHGIPL
jgi:hypothetical protein